MDLDCSLVAVLSPILFLQSIHSSHYCQKMDNIKVTRVSYFLNPKTAKVQLQIKRTDLLLALISLPVKFLQLSSVINSRTAIAGGGGLLLAFSRFFYDSKRSIGFYDSKRSIGFYDWKRSIGFLSVFFFTGNRFVHAAF